MKILVSYRAIPQSPGWSTGESVVRAFRGLGHDVTPYAKFYQKESWVENISHQQVLSDEYDLVLFMECNDGDYQYTELRSVRARKTAGWFFDTSYHQDRYRGLINAFHFDEIFLANPLTIEQYKAWGYENAHYLPYACDPELHMRPLEYPKTRDVVLVGSIRDDRVNLANTLDRMGIKLELIGGLFREEYIDALASAKIVVNQNPEIGAGLLNMRFFEAQVAGCLLITERRDAKINRNLLDQCLLMDYGDVHELARICKTALHSNQLDTLRQSAQGYMLDYHTYARRCISILKTVFPHESN